MSEQSINDGGPAFARPAFALPHDDVFNSCQEGISQRRLLAGMILGPVVAAVTSKPPKHEPTIETVRTIVQACVIFADELIKQTE